MADTPDGVMRSPVFLRPMARKILVVAGEESGDVYAGRLCAELYRLIEGVAIEGVGGAKARAAGVKTLYDIADLSSVGLASAMGKMGVFIKALNDIKARVASGEYDAVVLVDFPDFNLRVAKAADKSGTPVFYYVCPQFWAWRRYRLRAVKKYVDSMFVLFPFEEEFYKGRGINARFLGHPMLDELDFNLDRAGLRNRFGAKGDEILLGLVPGSRHGEVERILPLMLSAVRIIRTRKPVKVVIPCASSLAPADIMKIAREMGEEPQVVQGATWEVMNACDFLICKSGTSTLQAALAGVPMVIVYKTDMLSYVLAKSLSHTNIVGLPNIIAGKQVAPELLQGDATPQNLAGAVIPYLLDPALRENMRETLRGIRPMLGEPGAAGRAALVITDFLRRLKES
ncbi:MAG: lipid-A-disaccharide synthase [Nitrospinae bacterium]|nr:lipid-A-disaccharide synthase [Nitrospinota bacterium]